MGFMGCFVHVMRRLGRAVFVGDNGTMGQQHAARSTHPGAVVVGWDYGTYRTYGTYDYGTMGRGDYFVGDNGTMGRHPQKSFSKNKKSEDSSTDILEQSVHFSCFEIDIDASESWV